MGKIPFAVFVALHAYRRSEAAAVAAATAPYDEADADTRAYADEGDRDWLLLSLFAVLCVDAEAEHVELEKFGTLERHARNPGLASLLETWLNHPDSLLAPSDPSGPRLPTSRPLPSPRLVNSPASSSSTVHRGA